MIRSPECRDTARGSPIPVLLPLIGTFMAVLDFFIVNVAIPDIQSDLHASNAEIELVVAGYAIAYGSALIIGSRLGDRFGRRRTFLFGVATGGSIWWLVPGLFLNGMGTGLAVSPLASTVLSRIGERHAGAASGVLTTGLQVGNAIGVAAIGVIFYAMLRQPEANYAHAFNAALGYLIAMSVALIALVQVLPARQQTGAKERA